MVMGKLIFALALLHISASGALITVCASGCTYTSVATAITAANPGDIIEAKAGETFSMNAVLPWKNWGTTPIVIRSSRWMELPPPGYRVNESEHGALMPQFLPANNSEPIVMTGTSEQTIDAVDVTNNTLTLSSAIGSNGDPIACRPNFSSASNPTLPAPLTNNTVYYLTGVSGAVVSLQAYVGGPTIDITSTGSATGGRVCAKAKVGSNYQFDGIWFRTDPVITSLNIPLVVFGLGEESSYLGLPKGMRMTRSMITGRGDEVGYTQDGPRGGLLANAVGMVVEDSYIYNIKATNGIETKAIAIGEQAIDNRLKNNLLHSASINLLVGGNGAAIENVLPSVSMDRSYVFKTGSLIYNAGAGAPTGSAFYGRFYRNTSIVSANCASGQCYVADSSNVWQQNLTATYRSDNYNPKNLIEIKECDGCKFTRIVAKNGFAADDTGNPGYVFFTSCCSTLIPWGVNRNISFVNSYGYNTWRAVANGNNGFRASSNPTSITMRNILVENLADYPTMSIHPNKSDSQNFPFATVQKNYNSIMDHITVRPAATSPTGTMWSLFNWIGATGASGQMLGTKLQNTLAPQYTYSLFADGSDGTCGSGGLAQWVANNTVVQNNLQEGSSAPGYSGCTTNFTNIATIPYVSSTDSRLQPGSPWSADCVAGCAYTGTDGKDLGADVDLVTSETAGVVEGNPGWIPNLTIKMGSTRGVVSYWAPDEQVCTFTLYTDAARLVEDADTTGANKNDNRTGNVTAGRSRQFVLGTVAPLTANTTAYTYKLSCPGGGGQYRVGTLRTYPAASGAQQVGFSASGASVASQYSSSATMSSPTSISASVNPRFVIPQGTVRYWQTTSANGNGEIIATPAR
jgi:hypothetical protein